MNTVRKFTGEASILLSVHCCLSFGHCVASAGLWGWNFTCVAKCEGKMRRNKNAKEGGRKESKDSRQFEVSSGTKSLNFVNRMHGFGGVIF